MFSFKPDDNRLCIQRCFFFALTSFTVFLLLFRIGSPVRYVKIHCVGVLFQCMPSVVYFRVSELECGFSGN